MVLLRSPDGSEAAQPNFSHNGQCLLEGSPAFSTSASAAAALEGRNTPAVLQLGQGSIVAGKAARPEACWVLQAGELVSVQWPSQVLGWKVQSLVCVRAAAVDKAKRMAEGAKRTAQQKAKDGRELVMALGNQNRELAAETTELKQEQQLTAVEHKQQLAVLQQDLSRRAKKVLSLGASCSTATEEAARLAGERDQLKVAHGRAEQQLQASQAQLARAREDLGKEGVASRKALEALHCQLTLREEQVSRTQSLLKHSDAELLAASAALTQQADRSAAATAAAAASLATAVATATATAAAAAAALATASAALQQDHLDACLSALRHAHQCEKVAAGEEAHRQRDLASAAADSKLRDLQASQLSDMRAIRDGLTQARLREAQAVGEREAEVKLRQAAEARLAEAQAINERQNQAQVTDLAQAQVGHQGDPAAAEQLKHQRVSSEQRAAGPTQTQTHSGSSGGGSGSEGVSLPSRESELEGRNASLAEQVRCLRVDLEIAAAGMRRRDAQLLLQRGAMETCVAKLAQLREDNNRLSALQQQVAAPAVHSPVRTQPPTLTTDAASPQQTALPPTAQLHDTPPPKAKQHLQFEQQSSSPAQPQQLATPPDHQPCDPEPANDSSPDVTPTSNHGPKRTSHHINQVFQSLEMAFETAADPPQQHGGRGEGPADSNSNSSGVDGNSAPSPLETPVHPSQASLAPVCNPASSCQGGSSLTTDQRLNSTSQRGPSGGDKPLHLQPVAEGQQQQAPQTAQQMPPVGRSQPPQLKLQPQEQQQQQAPQRLGHAEGPPTVQQQPHALSPSRESGPAQPGRVNVQSLRQRIQQLQEKPAVDSPPRRTPRQPRAPPSAAAAAADNADKAPAATTTHSRVLPVGVQDTAEPLSAESGLEGRQALAGAVGCSRGCSSSGTLGTARGDDTVIARSQVSVSADLASQLETPSALSNYPGLRRLAAAAAAQLQQQQHEDRARQQQVPAFPGNSDSSTAAAAAATGRPGASDAVGMGILPAVPSAPGGGDADSACAGSGAPAPAVPSRPPAPSP
ncbi:MAG: hypothetical protein WDW36_000783 [Sanguina aurantia]